MESRKGAKDVHSAVKRQTWFVDKAEGWGRSDSSLDLGFDKADCFDYPWG